jgi:hypothetical protein
MQISADYAGTEKLLRTSADEKLVITDRGQPSALLMSPDGPDLAGRLFPKRDLHKMPKSKSDSTDYIFRGRDGR